MKDRSFKLLLTLIALALWGIVLRPLWQPTPAQAQGDKTVAAKYEYWIAVDDNQEKLVKRLDEDGKKGWRSVSCAVLGLNGFRAPQLIVLQERKIE